MPGDIQVWFEERGVGWGRILLRSETPSTRSHRINVFLSVVATLIVMVLCVTLTEIHKMMRLDICFFLRAGVVQRRVPISSYLLTQEFFKFFLFIYQFSK